jgi:2,3-dihydroxybiphenyl 1,2-dioxygenase
VEITALGYLGVGSSKIDDWASLATSGLGMQLVHRGAGLRALRMDDRRQRLIIDSSLADGDRYFGWEVADAAALERLGARLEKAGVNVRREPASVADMRFVRELISFADPAGNNLEAFWGAESADEPFQPSRMISGFRAGALGMGHVLLAVRDLDAALGFYRDLLGFRVSDYMEVPVCAWFLHVNSRHHSIALVAAPGNGMHHLMVELYMLDDVGQGYDLALADQDRVAVSLGRHSNDLMTSFYMRTPSDFLVEYGWGGLDVDDARWTPVQLQTVASFWGHDGLFRGVGGTDPPPMDLRQNAGQTPSRAPVQVMDGNYRRMGGTCPWWDSLKGA